MNRSSFPVLKWRKARLTCAVALAIALPPLAATAQQKASPLPTVEIAFVGDVMLDSLPGRAIRQGRDPFRPFAALLAQADIRVANLECVVSRRGRPIPGKPWTFRAHPSSLHVFKKHFDVAALANNHSGDFGPEAFADMLTQLEKANIRYVGGGRNLQAAHTPLILESKGLRIALLNYNEFFPRSFEAEPDRPGIAWSEDEQVMLDIKTTQRLYQPDILIPFMHWGWEYETQAGERQRHLAQLMIDAGASAVIGGHPHVTQNIEFYRGKPIIYSLGNFLFDGFTDTDTNTGWLVRLQFDAQGLRQWRSHVAHINSQGIPHPGPATEGVCWHRGMAREAACAEKK